MRTLHRILQGDARSLDGIADRSVQLVVTSPPYPMVAMWDGVFAAMDPPITECLARGDGRGAFDRMHAQLDRVWSECLRVLEPGGVLCVNVGDATRTLAGEFCLYPNHARLVTALYNRGCTPLPDILWRKPTNAPNKFMGSGMLPPGAYVTYEHEYILVFRAPGRRRMDGAARARRQASAYFFEERNVWFSDLWTEPIGTGQALAGGSRARSGAFPVEVPYRLILMYSILGDTVLDPFAGTGTTGVAAVASGRSSIGVESDAGLVAEARARLTHGVPWGRARANARLRAHETFVAARREAGRDVSHVSEVYGFPVMTRQERLLEVWGPASVEEGAEGCAVAGEPIRKHA
jgi:DNA modification methylase